MEGYNQERSISLVAYEIVPMKEHAEGKRDEEGRN